MHTALIGASRGIGRAAALEILESDPTNSVSLLLRSPVSLKSDPSFVNAIASGRARLVKGDAYSEVDVRTLLESTDIDSVVSTLGAVYPDGKRQFSWSKGFLLPSPEACTRAMLVLVKVLGDLKRERGSVPALVTVSVTGVGSSRVNLPYIYQQTIDDKRGVETVLSRASIHLTPDSDSPSSLVLDTSSLDSVTDSFLPNVMIVRPAQLKDTDGTRRLRAGETISTYSTGRVELGKWIGQALGDRETWMNRRITVGF